MVKEHTFLQLFVCVQSYKVVIHKSEKQLIIT